MHAHVFLTNHLSYETAITTHNSQWFLESERIWVQRQNE